jgi:hypothetical protein
LKRRGTNPKRIDATMMLRVDYVKMEGFSNRGVAVEFGRRNR